MIDPKDIIEKFSVDELGRSADDYYQALPDPTPLMAKPFSSFVEAHSLLGDMSLLLSGLKPAKTMTILEFAAGTCWLSRYLHQLGCKTISCDVSTTALEIGKRLFDAYPVIGNPVFEPSFLKFDGYWLDLPDESVDRIICLDGFHHVPNQEDILSDFFRVLKPGGIAGFSEPGRFHSKQPNA